MWRYNIGSYKTVVWKENASHLHDDMKVSHGGKQPSTGKKKPKGSKNDYSSTAGTSKNLWTVTLKIKLGVLINFQLYMHN